MGRFLRWLAIGFFVLFVLPLALLAWALFRGEAVPESSILHVTLDAPLLETAHPSLPALLQGRHPMTVHGLSQRIRRAAHDKHIVGLILDIRTPSMGFAHVAEIRSAIQEFRQSKKWNVSYLETAGTFGHGDSIYALACSTEKIFLSPPGEVSLSGLRSEVPFLKDSLARFHITPFTEQRYEFKNFANMFNQNGFTPEHLTALKTVMDDLQDTMLEWIAAGRESTPAEAKRWAEGSPYSAEEAKKLHLVDQVAYWDELLSEAEKIAGHPDPFIDADSYSVPAQLSHANDVAWITVTGPIMPGEHGKNPLEPSVSAGSDTIARAFHDARRAQVKAVLFRIDSPGGAYIASDVIRHEVEITRKAGIPVVVSMGNVAASGGYLVATDADHIVAEPATITGSIGVVATTFALRDFLHHWLGVSFGVYETLPHAGTVQWLDPPTQADRQRIGETLDRIYQEFVAKVAQGRHKTHDEIHQIAKGRIWSGRQALKNGLVDELGGMDTAIAHIRKRLQLEDDAPLRLVIYPEPDTPFAMLREFVGHGMQISMQPPEPWSRWLAPLQRALAPMEDTVLLAPWQGP